MSVLFVQAYAMLARFDLYLIRRNFAALYERVRREPTRTITASTGGAQRVCTAMDLAAIWYWKEVLCLQRSAATACLLRRHGVPASMLIGAQQMPFKAHAWVEVDGRVVNDKPYMRDIYAVLDRC